MEFSELDLTLVIREQPNVRDLPLICLREYRQNSFRLPPASPYDKFLKAAGCWISNTGSVNHYHIPCDVYICHLFLNFYSFHSLLPIERRLSLYIGVEWCCLLLSPRPCPNAWDERGTSIVNGYSKLWIWGRWWLCYVRLMLENYVHTSKQKKDM